MTKYFSEDFFKEVELKLGSDPAWQQATKGVKSTIRLSATDVGADYLFTIEDGTTRISKASAGSEAEFSFEGTYESWGKVARGEVDLQSAVLKGLLRFRGSITKILFYRDRFVRIADVMKSIPLEF